MCQEYGCGSDFVCVECETEYQVAQTLRKVFNVMVGDEYDLSHLLDFFFNIMVGDPIPF